MKRRLRKEMKAMLAAMPSAEAARRSQAACEHLLGLAEYRAAGAVMLYCPIVGEVNCIAVALSAWQVDKTVLLPKISLDQRHMLAVGCRSLDDDLAPGAYGIREPASGEPWPIEEIDFVVVPAVPAYDRAGNRLGRGGGFYDRFLSQAGRTAVACGLAFSQQLVGELPTRPNDCPVEVLVTDEQVLRFARAGG